MIDEAGMLEKTFPKGFNWECPLCGVFASVATADLENYECPKCHGFGLSGGNVRPGIKAVVVPKMEMPESILKFRNERFEIGVKKSEFGNQESGKGKKRGRKKRGA